MYTLSQLLCVCIVYINCLCCWFCYELTWQNSMSILSFIVVHSDLICILQQCTIAIDCHNIHVRDKNVYLKPTATIFIDERVWIIFFYLSKIWFQKYTVIEIYLNKYMCIYIIIFVTSLIGWWNCVLFITGYIFTFESFICSRYSKLVLTGMAAHLMKFVMHYSWKERVYVLQ